MLFSQDDLQLWHAKSTGFTIFGSFVGLALLTSSRFLFLSAGTSGAAKRLAAAALLGPLGAMAFGKTPTKDLDLSALGSEGSLELPLERVTACTSHRRWDLATYVRVAYLKEDTPAVAAFMPKNSFFWAGATEWAAKVEQARTALGAAPFRAKRG